MQTNPSLLAIALAIALSTTAAHAAQKPAADLIIRGGSVHDGSGSQPITADVVIGGDRILQVGPNAGDQYSAARVIDAHGKLVAPGFIDPHTHPETYIRSADKGQRRNAPWLFQGVTTIAIGIDGGGSPKIAENRAWFEANGVGTNLVPYVGFGAVRRAVLQDDARAPNAAELQQMQQLVATAMCEGAVGLSTGLFYAPQSFASPEEVVAVAREAAVRGGLYDTHQRDESSYATGLIASTREAIDIGRQTGMPVHFAHLKALGVDVHGQAPALVKLIDEARAEGLTVTADQYPWLASGTNLGASLLPRWAVDGGRPALLQRLAEPDTLAKIRQEMIENLRRRGGAQTMLLTSAGHPWTGKNLADMGKAWSLHPVDAALRIIEADEPVAGKRSNGSVASFNMDNEDVKLLMRQPWMVTSSDGSDGHPRQYASFPEKYARYVKAGNTLDLTDFIHKSTGLTAKILGLEQRGLLRTGYYADVVVLDPDAYAPRADYLNPRQLSEGVDTLLVNGQLAIDHGDLVDALPGRVLLHTPTAGHCP